MREKILRQLAAWHSDHPGRMLAIVIALSVIFALLATQLKITLRWSDLLPGGDKRTIEFNRIVEEFRTATSIIVVVQGEEQRIKQFADSLAPRLKNASLKTGGNSLHRLIQRVDYKIEVDFMRDHGFMLMKEDDLADSKMIFKDPHLPGLINHINDSMEKEYVGKEESISTREKEDQAVMFLDGIQNTLSALQHAAQHGTITHQRVHQAVDKLLLGEPYFLSYDKSTLILNAIPTFSVTDIGILIEGTEAIQKIVDTLLIDFPDVRAGLTGMIPVSHDEMVYSEKSLGYTTIIALAAILMILIVSLRMWVAPVFAIANLLVGILWAIGITTILIGQFNIMTQMMAVILLGLGIDFSIHLISGFTERRAAGDSIHLAMETTFLKSGKGIVTGGLTTAFAFLTMAISSSRGMKEMGIVTGTGLLAILVSTFFVLPIFLVLRERRIEKKQLRNPDKSPMIQRDISFRFLGQTGQWLHHHYRITILISICLTLGLIWFASRITFDQNYMNIEPEGLTSIVLQDTILDKFDLSMDYALILTDHIDESRRISEAYRDMGSVAMTEDISLYLPSVEQQEARKPHIEEIRREISGAPPHLQLTSEALLQLKGEIERLEMNIMEIQDMAYLGGQDKVDTKCKDIVGDPDNHNSQNLLQDLLNVLHHEPKSAAIGLSHFQRVFTPYFSSMVLRMCSTDPIQLGELPQSILDRYGNHSRNQFLVTVYPSGNIWQNAGFLHRFADDLERISDRATGMPPVFRALIDIIGRDGRNAMVLTIVMVFLLLWLDFRNPKFALMAMIPLSIGALWMVGLMKLTGQQFTVMNVMGLPMIIGIGIDDGVHIVHRWIAEGRGQIKTVFASTGKAILLTTLTTMLAFGSLIFSIWRGFGQLGSALFVGVGACFLTTVLILSGITGFIERKKS